MQPASTTLYSDSCSGMDGDSITTTTSISSVDSESEETPSTLTTSPIVTLRVGKIDKNLLDKDMSYDDNIEGVFEKEEFKQYASDSLYTLFPHFDAQLKKSNTSPYYMPPSMDAANSRIQKCASFTYGRRRAVLLRYQRLVEEDAKQTKADCPDL